MMSKLFGMLGILGCLATSLCAGDIRTVRAADPRNVTNGYRIPADHYVDQPYVVVTTNGDWVCVLTTGKGLEGQQGQHVISTISKDQGQTWSDPIDIEPDSGPEASWATPLLTPYGRIYVFYVFNGDEVVTLPNSERRVRSDTHGWYVFRYSDDQGKTWSAQRYRVPIRTTDVDRRNPWHGELSHFWSIDKPKVLNGNVYLAITKLGRFFMQDGEGWIIRSENLLTERDPDRILFRLLPDGEEGIKNPALGLIQEEFNAVPLEGKSLFAVCRLSGGTPAQSYSSDEGLTWSKPERMTFGPGAREMKNPRACAKLFKTTAGKYLFWFHNHGGKMWGGRNPAFLSGGILGSDGKLRWSEPELVLFDSNPAIRMSYPDLVEQDGKFWLTEAQKTVARVHPLDPAMLEMLWKQDSLNTIVTNGLIYSKLDAGDVVAHPQIPRNFGDLSYGGFTIEMLFELRDASAGKTLFSSMNDAGKGVAVSTATLANQPVLRIELSDGHRMVSWFTDPGAIRVGVPQHVAWICDFSAGVIMPVINAQLSDGGTVRAQGWGRIPKDLGEPKGTSFSVLDPQVKKLRLYRRPLYTSEVISNWRAESQIPMPIAQ